MSEATPIAIIEPNGLLRAVLRNAFGGANGWEVLACLEAMDEPQLIQVLATAAGSPVLLYGAPLDEGRIPALTEMRQRFPGLAVALLGPMPTMPMAQELMQMLHISAGGFVYLEHEQVSSVRDIEAACRVAASGRVVLDLPVLLDLAEGIAGTTRAEQRPADDETLLSMLAEGMTDEVIATRLDVPIPLLLMWLDDLYERIGALGEERDPRVFAVVHYLTQTGRAPLRLGREGAPPPAPPVEPEGEEPSGSGTAWESAGASSLGQPQAAPAAQEGPADDAPSGIIDWTPRASTVADDELEPSSPLDSAPEPGPGPEHEQAQRPGDEVETRRPPRANRPAQGADEPVIIEIPPPSARARRADRQAAPLDDEEFARFTQYGTPDDAASARHIVEWARERNLTCRYGTGRREGSFTVTYEHGSLNYWLLTVWAAGSVEVEFGALRAKAPFSNVDTRNELAERLRRVPGAEVREADLHGRVRMPLSVLASDGGWRVMREALDWAVEAIRERAA